MSYPNRRGSNISNSQLLTSDQQETLKYIKYIEEDDQIVSQKPLETTLNSLYLSSAHKISSGQENIFFTNLASNINYYPSWGGILPQNIPSNQGDLGLLQPTHRVYSSNLVFNEVDGDISSTGQTTEYATSATPSEKISLHGIKFRLGQDLLEENVLYYRLYLGGDNTGTKIYEEKFAELGPKSSGEYLEIWFSHPSEGRADQEVYAEVIIESELNAEDFQRLIVYATEADENKNWVELRYRNFIDKPISYGENAYATAVSRSNQLITSNSSGAPVTYTHFIELNSVEVYGNGTIKLIEEGVYAINLRTNIDIQTSNVETIEFWVEFLIDGVWTPKNDSGVKYEVSGRSEGAYAQSLLIDSSENDVSLRIMSRMANGNNRIFAYETLNNGVTVPSANLSVVRVSSAITEA